jgi:hypothetical protein
MWNILQLKTQSQFWLTILKFLINFLTSFKLSYTRLKAILALLLD